MIPFTQYCSQVVEIDCCSTFGIYHYCQFSNDAFFFLPNMITIQDKELQGEYIMVGAGHCLHNPIYTTVTHIQSHIEAITWRPSDGSPNQTNVTGISMIKTSPVAIAKIALTGRLCVYHQRQKDEGGKSRKHLLIRLG